MLCCSEVTREELNTLDSEYQPAEYGLAVMMLCRPVRNSPWATESWIASGVVCGDQYRERGGGPTLVRDSGSAKEYLFSGLRLKLYKDESESYYHNLMAPNPQLYVVARAAQDGGRMEPFHVSASFDEGNAYLEGDDEVYGVAMPPEVAVWMERFVLTHYVPEPRKKRKRRNWHEEGRR